MVRITTTKKSWANFSVLPILHWKTLINCSLKSRGKLIFHYTGNIAGKFKN